MAFSGGVFSRIHNWVTDKAGLINITASRMDQEFDGMATGLSTCILKDGTQTITANIPFNSKKITGLAAGTASGDAVHFGQTATDTTVGLVELATQAEVTTGSDTTRAVTPATLKGVTDLIPYAAGSSGSVSASSTGVIALNGTGYKWVDVRIDNFDCSVNGSNLCIRYSTDNGSSYVSSGVYLVALAGMIANGTENAWSATAATSWEVMIGVQSTSDGNGSVILRIPTPSNTSHRKMIQCESGYVSSAGIASLDGVLSIASNDDITHLQIFNNGGGTVTFDYVVTGLR